MTPLSWIFLIYIAGCRASATSSRDFKSYPTTVKTFENDTVLLPCYVEELDGSKARVRWWRKGKLLADSGEPTVSPPKRVRMWSNQSLEVHHVQPEDSGEYVCQASRPAPQGHVTQVHEIEVMYPPSVQIVPESGELEVNLGEEVDMACKTTGVPVPFVTWKSKSEEIPLLYDRWRLRFHADNHNMSGRYTCTATNGVGEPAIGYIDLRIRYKPEIQVEKNWIHASPGIRADLSCKVNAWPEAKVDWYFKNEKIVYSPRMMKFTTGLLNRLIIKNVRVSDFGEYLCRASNSLGITEAIVELSGVANPAVFKKESHSISKTAYNFIWEVDSYSPIIEYQFWFRWRYPDGTRGEWHKLFIPSGSEAVGPVHARSFNLTGLVEATHYEALVLSRNRYGWSRSSRLFKFSAESSPYDEDNDDRIGAIPDEKSISVVQLTSMSQHSPYGIYNGASRLDLGKLLSIFLSGWCIYLIV
ncbi:neurotrimin-like isoform X2 [Prorops nasuta]|uniref:neurotrimin-like isoform X2 n=1 Tax=Prorops nasuta TaxID=863751 RepID=UPI0034CE74EA